MSLFRGLKGFVGLALVASVITAHPAILRAQTTSASVSGTVQDSQGGVLPGVTVTLTSRSQGNVLTAVTDEGGRFVFPIVRPDTYSLQVDAPGLQDTRADERGRERQRQAVGRNAHAGSRRAWPRKSASRRAPSSCSRTAVSARSRSRARRSKNIASNGRMLFNFATLVPGVLSQRCGRHRNRVGQRFHRERPASRTPTTSRSMASPTSTPGTTAATWRRRTSTRSPSSRSSPTPTRRSTGAPSVARCRWLPRAARRVSTARAIGMDVVRGGTPTHG